MKIEFSSSHGLISVYPPPGRGNLALEFFTNTSEKLLSEGGTVEPCPVQRDCMINQTRMTIEGSLVEIQKMLRQRFVSYIGQPNFYGLDEIKVWVSDQGFTDRSYNNALHDTVNIRVRILPVNDEPNITATQDVLKYAQGQVCRVDFILERRNEIPGASMLTRSLGS